MRGERGESEGEREGGHVDFCSSLMLSEMSRAAFAFLFL